MDLRVEHISLRRKPTQYQSTSYEQAINLLEWPYETSAESTAGAIGLSLPGRFGPANNTEVSSQMGVEIELTATPDESTLSWTFLGCSKSSLRDEQSASQHIRLSKRLQMVEDNSLLSLISDFFFKETDTVWGNISKLDAPPADSSDAEDHSTNDDSDNAPC